MRALGKKLNSCRGASILFAMMFLIIVVILGSIIMTAAVASSSRISREAEFQKDYHAVASAADLLRKDIQGLKFEGSYKKIDSFSIYIDEDGEEFVISNPTSFGGKSAVLSGSKILEKLNSLSETGINSDFGKLYFSTAQNPQVRLPTVEMNYDLKFPKSDELPEVTGKLAVNTGSSDTYKITATLYTERDGQRSNAMTLTFTPKANSKSVTNRTEDGGTTTTTVTYTTTVTWNDPVLAKGATLS